MAAPGSIVGFVKKCTAQDPVTFACTSEAWMPEPPPIIPPLTVADSAWLFAQSACVLAYAWGWKVLGRQIR